MGASLTSLMDDRALDMFYAILQGTQNAISEHLGAAYFIPILAMPALLVTHYLIFGLLLRKS